MLDAFVSQAHDLAHPRGSGSEFWQAKETADEFGDFIDALFGQSDRDDAITFVRLNLAPKVGDVVRDKRGLS